MRNFIYLVEGTAQCGKCSCYLVNKADAGQTSPSDDVSLGPTNSNVVTDYKEFDGTRFVWVSCGILLLSEPKIQDVASVIPYMRSKCRWPVS